MTQRPAPLEHETPPELDKKWRVQTNPEPQLQPRKEPPRHTPRRSPDPGTRRANNSVAPKPQEPSQKQLVAKTRATEAGERVDEGATTRRRARLALVRHELARHELARHELTSHELNELTGPETMMAGLLALPAPASSDDASAATASVTRSELSAYDAPVPTAARSATANWPWLATSTSLYQVDMKAPRELSGAPAGVRVMAQVDLAEAGRMLIGQR